MDEMAQGLRATFGRASLRMNWISENLANSRTPGYRAGIALEEPFSRILGDRLGPPARQRMATDLSQGAIRLTEQPLDIALQGDGFFVVRAGERELLTRNGAFQLTPDGELVNASGHAVLDTDGEPIRIPVAAPLDRVVVGEDGSVRADGARVGRLRIERVADEQHLRRVGTTLFEADAVDREITEATRVVGRALESSNTEVFQEMADMIVLTRSVEAAQQAQRNETDALRKMMDALG